MNRTADVDAVALLALARLLPAPARGETRDRIARDLAPMVEHRLQGDAWHDRLDRAVDGLIEAGHIARQGRGKAQRLAITESGRTHALGALGLNSLPEKTTWARLKSPHLVALALGHPTAEPAEARRIASASGLKAELIRSKHELQLPERPTARDAGNALAASLLGLEPGRPFTKDEILAKLLADAGITLQTGQKPTPKAIGDALFRRVLDDQSVKSPFDQLAARAAKARSTSAGELGAAVIRRWIDHSEESRVIIDDKTPTLEDFARFVVQTARSSETGQFGGDKVFINHIWRAARFNHRLRGLDFDGFKARLVEAHGHRLLELGRGDLIEAMDPTDVRESETHHHNAVYHFVRVEGDLR